MPFVSLLTWSMYSLANTSINTDLSPRMVCTLCCTSLARFPTAYTPGGQADIKSKSRLWLVGNGIHALSTMLYADALSVGFSVGIYCESVSKCRISANKNKYLSQRFPSPNDKKHRTLTSEQNVTAIENKLFGKWIDFLNVHPLGNASEKTAYNYAVFVVETRNRLMLKKSTKYRVSVNRIVPQR